jgi:hypothetical protein
MPHANVRIELTAGLSSLTLVYTGIKDITILITNNAELEARFPYKKHLLLDFLHAIDGHQIEEIEAGQIPHAILDTFLSVIRQVNDRVDKHDVIGIDSNYILPRRQPLDVQHDETLPARRELYTEKKALDLHVLKNLAEKINKLRSENKPVPNFEKKTAAQYRKIKNFIYNLTQLILSWNEIDTVSQLLAHD